MSIVVFDTPGLIDVRAFTVLGAHAKPNSANPIGFFGTGLKYAISVLVRLGAEPVVWVGKDKFTFTKRVSTFRGSPLETIKMTVLKAGNRRTTSYELSFTTRYGANWEPWQAFRELESNTRDEGGKTWLAEGQPASAVIGIADTTRIVVELEAFYEAAQKIDEIFLPRARRTGDLLEAFEGESEKLYYRTMRVLDLSKPSIFTYNLLEKLELTEDRTLKYEYYAKQIVARWALTEASVDQVERILKAEKDAWEHGLEFPGHVRPSPAFEEVMRARRRGVSKNAWVYYSGYAPRSRSRTITTEWQLFDEHPKPWRVEKLSILDADGTEVFTAPDGYYDEWERTAQKVVALLRAGSLPPVSPTPIVPHAEPGGEVEERDEVPF